MLRPACRVIDYRDNAEGGRIGRGLCGRCDGLSTSRRNISAVNAKPWKTLTVNQSAATSLLLSLSETDERDLRAYSSMVVAAALVVVNQLRWAFGPTAWTASGLKPTKARTRRKKTRLAYCKPAISES